MTTQHETIKIISERSGIPTRLIRAVLLQLGGGDDARESCRDIANYGVDGGFCGFTYYADTVKFFKAHRPDIVDLVNRMADDLGENPADMVAGFNCLGGSRGVCVTTEQQKRELEQAKREWLPSVSRCLYGGRLTDDDTQVANALAWFAAEEVARAVVND
jgi:hypothetical protein